MRQSLVRVFVSSAFWDMEGEREELAKRIFPQLRKLCEDKDVGWADVDLRWGITEEQSLEGKVLPICLEEIDHCTYFIAFLGERYGTALKWVPGSLLDKYPWLKEHLTDSVTELEILHGALGDLKTAKRVFFYFRDPGYAERQLPERSARFFSESHAVAAKLHSLKDRIRQSGFPLKEGYSDPRALGTLVLADLTRSIEETYPTSSVRDPLDQVSREHQSFARSRSALYIGADKYFPKLDEIAAYQGPSLVVVEGASGAGKTALLANWSLNYVKGHPHDLLIMHFIGSSPNSTDWAGMLRRVMGELKRRFMIPEEIPYEADALRVSFANWLYIADRQITSSERDREEIQGTHQQGFRSEMTLRSLSRVVIVLDALNQLEDREGALDLTWLPPVLPSRFRFLVSTLPGRPLTELRKRNPYSLMVEPLSDEERRQLISKHLALYGKQVSEVQLKELLSSEQTKNPLYLCVLLDELRLIGSYSDLDPQITEYLSSKTASELYEKILARWEQDYGEGMDLVRETMSMLWAARRGLSESELLDMLGSNSIPLPRAHWAPLHLAARNSLVNRNGIITFGHDFLRHAVESMYIREPGGYGAHQKLARYFARRSGKRQLEELPWQLSEAGEWQGLCSLLTNEEFFVAAWNASEFEVKYFWSRLESSSPIRMNIACGPILRAPGRGDAQYISCLATLLNDTGYLQEALALRSYVVEYFRNGSNLRALATALGNQGATLHVRSALDEAMVRYREQEQICRRIEDFDGLQAVLGNQALILKSRGDFDGALTRLDEQERICKRFKNREGLQRALGNKAVILRSRGELAEAVRLHHEQARICQELGNQVGLANSLCGEALVLIDRSDLKGALSLLDMAEKIYLDLGDKTGVANVAGNRAVILEMQGDFDKAMILLDKQELLYRQLNNLAGRATAIGNRGLILQGCGRLSEAMTQHKEEEDIYRRLNDPVGLLYSLNNQGAILQRQGQLEEALAIYRQTEEYCRALKDYEGIAISLANQAWVLGLEREEFSSALALAESAYSIALEKGYDARAKEIMSSVITKIKSRTLKMKSRPLSQR